MSSWDGNECPYCGAKYGRLRTGLNYMAVYDMLWSASDDPARWRYRHRNAVLGAWHAIKLRLWEEHVHGCAMLAGERAAVLAARTGSPAGEHLRRAIESMKESA